MKNQFDELFSSFKVLNEFEKKKAIVEFLKQNIISCQELNKTIGVNTEADSDLNNIISSNSDDMLDEIYKLIHILTEQIENFSEKVASDFFE